MNLPASPAIASDDDDDGRVEQSSLGMALAGGASRELLM